MFIIEEQSFGQMTLYTLRNEDTGEYVSILPGYGAIIHRLGLLADSGQLVELIDGYENSEQLMAEGSHSYKGSLLFPFPNRVKNGAYPYGGEIYQLPLNETSHGHALHGFLFNADLEVVAKGASATGAFLILEYEGKGTEQGYPFKYVLNVDIRLNDEEFTCKIFVQNQEDWSIPVGGGYHPYFKLGSRINDLLLKMPIQSQLELDYRMIPTGREVKPEKYAEFSRIEDEKLDNCYRVKEKDQKAITQLYDPRQNIKLTVWQQTGAGHYNFLQVYTPDSRGSIAIEPMTCAPDAFNNGQGLVLLQPDESFEATFGVRLE